jgi:hypothetical protein
VQLSMLPLSNATHTHTHTRARQAKPSRDPNLVVHAAKGLHALEALAAHELVACEAAIPEKITMIEER